MTRLVDRNCESLLIASINMVLEWGKMYNGVSTLTEVIDEKYKFYITRYQKDKLSKVVQ